MDSQHQLIKLAPYYAPTPTPSWQKTRRLYRHGFLSNRWGLQRHHFARTSSMLTHQTFIPFNETLSILPSHREELVMSHAASGRDMRLALNPDINLLRYDIHSVAQSVHNLSASVNDMSRNIAKGFDELETLLRDHGITGKQFDRMQDFHSREKADLEVKLLQLLNGLQKEKEEHGAKVDGLGSDLTIANLNVAAADQSLAELKRDLVSETHRADYWKKWYPTQLDGSENPDAVITEAFLDLRGAILEFCRNPTLQLRTLSGIEAGVFCEPATWNQANIHQKRRRVMGKIFHLLYRHILRPGLRIFGLQAFIKSGENQWISGVEAQLRALERDMEAKGKSHVCPLIDNSISD